MSNSVSCLYRNDMVEKNTTINLGQGNTKTLKERFPVNQALKYNFLPSVSTLTFSNAPLNLLRNGSTKYQAVVQRGAFSKIGHAVIKLTVTVNTSPVTLAPVSHWFSQIQIKNNGTNEIIATMYNDTIAFNLLSGLKKGQTQALFRNINIDYSNNGYLGQANITQVGQQVFYLPLTGTFLSQMEIFFQNSSSDLIIELTPDSVGPIVSGSGTIDTNLLQLMVETQNLSQSDLALHEQSYKDFLYSSVYLDPVPVNSFNQTMSASSQTKFDLSNVTGKCAFLLACIRSTGGGVNANNGYWNNLYNIGDNEGASIDLLDPASQSILGSGTAIPTKFLRNEKSIHFYDSDWNAFKPFYILPFCDDIRKAFKGTIDGYFKFDGTKYYLSVNTPVAPTAEVQTITLSAAPTAGSFFVSFRGEVSDPVLYNATTSQIATAIQSMREFRRSGITVVVNQVFNGNTSATLTFTTPQTSGLLGDRVEIISNMQGTSNVPVTATSAITTQGTAGLPSASYDVIIYAYIYKKISMYNGKLISEIL